MSYLVLNPQRLFLHGSFHGNPFINIFFKSIEVEDVILNFVILRTSFKTDISEDLTIALLQPDQIVVDVFSH